ncbi:MAG: iron export ABC transporter permease subunit FetB [Epulopiscium sp.]|nr:iron export ABC transporter permease subunit FetB [Candidatus Epulonipiscium sp.]
MNYMESITTGQVLLALVLVCIALYLSFYFKVNLEKDILVATIRAFLQLMLIGYLLTFIFNLKSPIYTTVMIFFMAGIATYHAGKRGEAVQGSYWISGIAIYGTTIITIGILSGFGIIPYEPQMIIPVAGMVIGNVMNAASLALMRMHDELKDKQNQIEAALSLGASPRQAANPAIQKAIQISMIPVIDRAKIVGIVSLPGGMSGMILAGASPLAAVRFQVIIMYMLLGSPFLTVGIAVALGYRQYFTKFMQLKL